MEPVLCPVPRFEGLRITLIVQTEQRRKPHVEVYTYNSKELNISIQQLKGRSRCFVFDYQLGGCEVLKASKPKRSENAFNMYAFLRSETPKEFQHSEEYLQIKDILKCQPNNSLFFLIKPIKKEIGRNKIEHIHSPKIVRDAHSILQNIIFLGGVKRLPRSPY